MAETISMICSAVTNAVRWNGFQGRIELSNGKTVCWGSDSVYATRGILVIGGPEPQKTQAEIDAEAYAVALRYLFDDLAAGNLAVAGGIVGDAMTVPAPIQSRAWRGCWKLIVDGQNATLQLLKASGELAGEYVLDAFAAAVELPCVAPESQMSALPTPGKVNARPGRKMIDDTQPLRRLIELLSSGKGFTVHSAVTLLWNTERENLHLEGASFRAAHERLRGKLKKTHIISETQEGDLVKLFVPA